MWKDLSFDTITPSNLSTKDLWNIYDIEQDMWSRAEGLGEYLTCDICERNFSKQDIYDRNDRDLYIMTVAEIEYVNWWELPFCPCCWNELKHIFPRESYIEEMKNRYSRQAHLVIMKAWETIVWFMDGYVWDIDSIYKTEFSDHYNAIGIDEIKRLIRNTLDWVLPDEFFSCASSGTREWYMNFFHIYNLLQYFFTHFPRDIENVTWLSELHSWGPYNKIFWKLGTKSIWIRNRHVDLIQTSDTYDSDIYVHPYFWRTCREAFVWVNVRDFISTHK